ncbi:MAG: molybdenum cofactor guanylyltransferase [Desulfobacteraceae bacterium]|nr:molybdenum cofactor guanylyltransferase [Desulfobacteraceae bacterium]
MYTACTGVILAGGLNSRFGGQSKALLEVGDRRIIDRVLDAFSKVFDQVLLVTNEPLRYLPWDLQMVTDIHPVRSSLAGLHAGLFYVRTPFAFFSACDAPFIRPGLIRAVVERIRPDIDIVMPRNAIGSEPLAAAYARRCLDPIQRQLAAGDLKIDRFFSKMRVRWVSEKQLRAVDPNLESFINVNTPEDLVLARQRAMEQAS